MSKFFGSIFNRTDAVQSAEPAKTIVYSFAPKPLTNEENAIATLVYCSLNGRSPNEEVVKTLNEMPVDGIEEPFLTILSMWKNTPGRNDISEQIETMFSVVLERTIKTRRQKNADFQPLVGQDIYDRTGV
jgi:hypothetical protein